VSFLTPPPSQENHCLLTVVTLYNAYVRYVMQQMLYNVLSKEEAELLCPWIRVLQYHLFESQGLEPPMPSTHTHTFSSLSLSLVSSFPSASAFHLFFPPVLFFFPFFSQVCFIFAFSFRFFAWRFSSPSFLLLRLFTLGLIVSC
jgi:hypothetical protein